MNKFKFFSVFLAASLALFSCSKDEPKKPDDVDDLNGKMEELTPSESKQFLVSASNEFMAKFRAGDQRSLIVLTSWFSEKYGNLEMPEDFEFEFEDNSTYVSRMMKGIAEGLSEANPSRVAASVNEYVYKINFERFKGIYEPGRDSWKRTGDSNDVIFRFKGENGQKCELKASLSGGTSDATFTEIDEWEDYDYQNGTYVSIEDRYNYEISIPKKVVVTLASGDTELVKAIVDSDIDVKGHKLNISTNVTAMNIFVAAKVAGNDSQVTMEASLKVSDETILTSKASVNGKHLCDKDYYMKEPVVSDMIQKGNATVSVMNKVRVDAEVTYNSLIQEILDYPYWENYYYSSKEEAKAAAESAVETLNENMKAQLRYNNKETVQATLIFATCFDSWGSGWEYGMEPLLKFSSDQSTYSFEEYFEKGFSNVEDTFSDLMHSYEKVWESAR